MNPRQHNLRSGPVRIVAKRDTSMFYARVPIACSNGCRLALRLLYYYRIYGRSGEPFPVPAAERESAAAVRGRILVDMEALIERRVDDSAFGAGAGA